MKILVFFSMLALPLALNHLTHAEMYQWTDNNGVKHYSNSPPPESVTAYQTEPEIGLEKQPDRKHGKKETLRRGPANKAEEQRVEPEQEKTAQKAEEDKQVLESAKQVGLNISKISENALLEAIGRLTGPKRATSLRSPIRIEGRGRDSNPGARLHRPVGYQATSPRPLFC